MARSKASAWPKVARMLADAAGRGAEVRLCFGAPDSDAVATRDREEELGGTLAHKIGSALTYYRPLIGVEGCELRLHSTTLYESLFRYDDETMVNPHAYGHRRSPLGAAVDLRAAADIEDVDDAAVLVDPADDAVGAAPGAMTASERPAQRLADPVRVDRKRAGTELKCHGGNSFREPLGNCSPCGRLEPDLVPLRRFGPCDLCRRRLETGSQTKPS